MQDKLKALVEAKKNKNNTMNKNVKPEKNIGGPSRKGVKNLKGGGFFDK